MSAQRWILGLFGLLLAPGLALGALGEQEATVHEDAVRLKGAIKSTERAAYRVHEIQLPSGTALREFVGPDGRVFAVAWNGPSLPNLSQVLGTYFDAYAGAEKAKQGTRTRLDIRQSAFVMHSGGHMRAFSGHAYLPQAVPAGVSLEDIR